MADLQLKMIEPVFRTQYRVIYGDTDAGGVGYNAHFLRFMEIGRTEMMRNLAVPYSEMEQQGIIIPVIESYLRYKASGQYDDLLTIATSLAEVSRFSCRFHYRITRTDADKNQGQLLVKGFTKHACTDRFGKLIPFPEPIREQFMQVQARQKEQSV